MQTAITAPSDSQHDMMRSTGTAHACQHVVQACTWPQLISHMHTRTCIDTHMHRYAHTHMHRVAHPDNFRCTDTCTDPNSQHMSTHSTSIYTAKLLQPISMHNPDAQLQPYSMSSVALLTCSTFMTRSLGTLVSGRLGDFCTRSDSCKGDSCWSVSPPPPHPSSGCSSISYIPCRWCCSAPPPCLLWLESVDCGWESEACS